MEILATQLLVRNLIPHASTIVTNFHALGPPTPTVRPPRHLDLSVMDNHILVDGRHNRARDRHGLDTEAIAVRGVVFADLRGIVDVFFHLDGRHGRIFDYIDARQPFAGARANVAHYDDAEGRAVDGGEGFAVHFPCEHHFVDFHFVRGHADGVVVDVALFEICVCAKEFNVGAGFFEAAAVLYHFFEGHADVACGTDGAFTPGRVDELVAVARIVVDLLDAAGAAALQCNSCGHAGEFCFVLELCEGDFHGLVDKAFDFEEVFSWVDFGDAAVIADEVVFVGSDFGLCMLVHHTTGVV
jgi:hypothetical protein